MTLSVISARGEDTDSQSNQSNLLNKSYMYGVTSGVFAEFARYVTLAIPYAYEQRREIPLTHIREDNDEPSLTKGGNNISYKHHAKQGYFQTEDFINFMAGFSTKSLCGKLGTHAMDYMHKRFDDLEKEQLHNGFRHGYIGTSLALFAGAWLGIHNTNQTSASFRAHHYKFYGQSGALASAFLEYDGHKWSVAFNGQRIT